MPDCVTGTYFLDRSNTRAGMKMRMSGSDGPDVMRTTDRDGIDHLFNPAITEGPATLLHLDDARGP